MGNAKKTDPLTTAVAVILAGATVAPAVAQTRLDVYSDDFSGGSMAPPSSAVRDTRINMHVPRLHAVRDGIAALRAELGSHSHPPHEHPPHVHITNRGQSGTVSGDADGANMVTVYSEQDQRGALETMSVNSNLVGPDGRISLGVGMYTTNFADSNRGQGGDGGGDGY